MNWSMITCAPLAKSPKLAFQMTRIPGRSSSNRTRSHHRSSTGPVDDGEPRWPSNSCASATCRRPDSCSCSTAWRWKNVPGRVLAAQPDAMAVAQQRRVGQHLGRAPVERQLALVHAPPVIDDARTRGAA